MYERLARHDVDRRVLFVGIVAAMVIVAFGHLYLVEDLTTFVAGLPLWIWVHVGVVAVLLGAAWIATGIATAEEV